jgi:hypothetical protein
MSTSPASPGELCIELAEPNELFEQRRADVANGAPAIPPGIDRIRGELGSGAVKAPACIAIVLPHEHVASQTEQNIRDALARHCEIGIKDAQNQLKELQREGRQTLLLGVVILAVALVLSALVLKSKTPEVFRDFFGNGLLLVAAWVGMWYPLDTLIYAGRPFRTEQKLLRTIQSLKVDVRIADASAAQRN